MYQPFVSNFPLNISNMCQFFLNFSYPSKFLSDKRSILKRKPSILRNCDGQFPAFFPATIYINNRTLMRQSPRCTLLATADPPQFRIGNHMIPQNLPQILLDSLSSQNKFQNFTHLESERNLFPQCINDLQFDDKNFHHNLCILHGNISQIKVKTVKNI